MSDTFVRDWKEIEETIHRFWLHTYGPEYQDNEHFKADIARWERIKALAKLGENVRALQEAP